MMINTSVGATNDITYSDWLHASIFVTGYGDIRVSYFQQFVSSFIEVQRRRKAVSLINFCFIFVNLFIDDFRLRYLATRIQWKSIR